MSERSDTCRKLIYMTQVSIDGFVARPKGELDWSVPHEDVHRFINDQMHHVDTFLFGRRMYETMVVWDDMANDPDLTEYEHDFASTWLQQTKIVFSSTLGAVRGNARLASEDLGSEVAQLKAAPGKDIAIGGATLASSAFNQHLIDEVHLFVHPTILGSGKPCFPNLNLTVNLALVETRQFESGVVYLKYERN
jgi:dihydrofolate reductase